MPRQPRLDAPGVLHQGMGRGIERIKIFRADSDQQGKGGSFIRFGQLGPIFFIEIVNFFEHSLGGPVFSFV